MRTKLAWVAAVLLTATGAVGAAGAEEPNVIELRQTGLDLLSGTFAGINAVIAAKGDVKKLEAPAKAIQRWAALFPSLFPKGSDTGHNTKALPEIWSDNAGFMKAAATLGEAAGKLVEQTKTGDLETVTVAAKSVGDACGACHRTYRAK